MSALGFLRLDRTSGLLFGEDPKTVKTDCEVRILDVESLPVLSVFMHLCSSTVEEAGKTLWLRLKLSCRVCVLWAEGVKTVVLEMD